MYYQTETKQNDHVVPPEAYIAQEEQAEQRASGRTIRAALLRSFSVLVSSFFIVFLITNVLVTWPLWPTRIGYFLSQIGRDSVSEATAASAALIDTETDSDGDGYSDGEELAYGYDPYNSQPVKLDTDNDGLKDTLERDRYGTDPLKYDSDGDGYSDAEEITHGYSPLKPADYDNWVKEKTSAVLRIPKIEVEVPVVWTTDVENIYEDLKNGVTHYPGTPDPGERGRVVISGHSSSFAWDWTSYSTAFVLLDKLEVGDEILVDYMGMTYQYVVNESVETDPKDTSNFSPTPNATLTLLTCTPVGTTDKRLYVNATLNSAQTIDR